MGGLVGIITGGAAGLLTNQGLLSSGSVKVSTTLIVTAAIAGLALKGIADAPNPRAAYSAPAVSFAVSGFPNPAKAGTPGFIKVIAKMQMETQQLAISVQLTYLQAIPRPFCQANLPSIMVSEYSVLL